MSSEQLESRLIGIDLGTTNSVVGYLDHAGVPASVVNFEGDVVTPSQLFIDGDAVVVGSEAAKAGRRRADGLAQLFKRFMGEGDFPEQVDGRTWRPEVLSAILLRRLRTDAERRLGEVGAAVITVPAYFDESRRRATSVAAEIAGLPVVDLINEPTAAALAYAYQQATLGKAKDEVDRVLVFDLGGGTLDVTVLRVLHGREYRTVATDGEVQLGGVDWDLRLRDHLAEQFRDETKHDPLESAQGRLEFLQLAEKAKKTLTIRDTARVPCLFEGRRCALKVDRETFEELTIDLLDRARMTAELVLSQARLRWPDIHTVLTIGGSTRMPMVGRMLEELTGKTPKSDVSVDEGVAHGAAIYAKLRREKSDVRVTNVNSLSYRVVAAPRGKPPVAHVLIAKNSPLPAVGRHVFRTQRPGQKNCRILVCDGESEEPEFCNDIGKVVIDDLPQDESKRWFVKVKICCQEDGQLAVNATVYDPDRRDKVVKQATATLLPAHGMSAAEVLAAGKLVAGLDIT